MRVAILGCGPSGLVAAHAAMSHRTGVELNIFSRPEPSPIYGAQYLHQPIPFTFACQAPPRVIRYQMRGEPEAYLKKVYGDAWDGTISDDLRDQAHLAWDLRATYNELWEVYEPFIVPIDIPPAELARRAAVETVLDQFDLVINTIPRPALCILPAQHRFVSTHIWALGDSPLRRVPVVTEDGIIQYNGDSEPGWYRTSCMYDYSTVEWPGHLPRPPVPGIARVAKPLSHTCDCFPDVVHLGRMGRWQNGRLVHHVYADTIEQLMLKERAA